MSPIIMLDLTNARIAEAHLEAERSRNRRRLVLEQRTARNSRRVVSRRRGPFRRLRCIRAAGPTRQEGSL
jgi:hypothetical protein